MKVGLALGGGAARGLAHIGVLKVLERERIGVDLVTGTSMGALVGGLYAADQDALKLENDLGAFFRSPAFRKTKLHFLRERRREKEEERRSPILFNLANFLTKGWVIGAGFTRQSFIPTEELLANLGGLLSDREISTLPIPFAAVALDIENGQPVLLARGSLKQAVMASSALPGIFPPVTIDGRLLVDGGWTEPVPAAAARRMGAEFVIAVDVTGGPGEEAEMDKGLNILLRAYTAAHLRLKEEILKDADWVLRPDTSGIHWADFSRFTQSVQAGEAAAASDFELIRREITRRKTWSVKSWFGDWAGR